MKRTVWMKTAGMACALLASASGGMCFGATKIWTGGGADDNLSTPANWADGTTPTTGDCLVFAGDRRTTPVNDFDPSTTSFKGLVFSNDCTACSAAFTLTGNELVLTGAENRDFPSHSGYFGILVAHVSDVNASITNVLACDIRLPSNARLGNWNAERHHLTFTGTVTGTGTLLSYDQYHGKLRFDGPVKGFSSITRLNGSRGEVWLRSSANEFSVDAPTMNFREGDLCADGIAALGGSCAKIALGQDMYLTPGRFIMNATEDVQFDGPLCVNGPRTDVSCGSFLNAVEGTTFTLTGDLTTMSAASGNKPGPGTCVTFGGVGDVVYAGNVLTPSTWLEKRERGTWTIAAESTTAATGTLTVVAGTLIHQADYSSAGAVIVNTGAVLSGTGTVSAITFKTGSRLKVMANADGVIAPLTVTGTVSRTGLVTVSPGANVGSFAAGTRAVLLKAKDFADNGQFTLDDSWPSSARLLEEDGKLVLSVPSARVQWKGDVANNVWDTSTPNWKGGAVYSDNNLVWFDDTADADTTNVVISAAVRPDRVVVSGTRDYVFSGAGILGDGDLLKTGGASILTLANTNAYTGATTVESGALQLDGVLKDTAIVVREGAAFTNTPNGSLTGAASFTFNGAAFELNGTNDFTGDVVASAVGEYRCVVKGARALGLGTVDLRSGYFVFKDMNEPFGAGRLLRTAAAGEVRILGAGGSTGWLGDMELGAGNRTLQLSVQGGCKWAFGSLGGDTVIRAAPGEGGQIYLRDSGTYHFYSRIDFGDRVNVNKTDGNTVHLYATGNTWRSMGISVGSLICHATNTLACAPLTLGQAYGGIKFTIVLDLNGYDQTISSLKMNKIDEGTTMTVKSTAPAMLTVSNATDTVTARPGAKLTGKVTLRKQGAGNWSLGMANASEGNVVVEEGVLTLTADDVLPTASRESFLKIVGSGRVAVAGGVTATVSMLAKSDTSFLTAGLYGGEGCAVRGARIMPELFAPGAGAVRVLHGNGGTLLILK